ncbi:MAG: hypothetical protein IJP16_03025 [Clostridia bacterium]|nr:hypothetical protein [Clostridia bacterium]
MKFNRIFSSHTVFAANKPIRIYGEGEGSGILEFAGQTRDIVCENGFWYTELPPMNYGGPYTLKLISNGVETVLDDIFVGVVLLCAGQSNIELRLSETNTPKESYESNEALRIFEVDKITKNPLFTAEDGWVKADKDTVYNWTAIGYLAGMDISRDKGVAVGIINCNQGASIIESWVPEGTFEKIGIDIPADKKGYNHYYEPYQKWNKNGMLYEKQLRQVFPFSLSGVIWYQGESDSAGEETYVYDRELCELIRVWRDAFKDEGLQFYVIQIADFRPKNDPSRDLEAWARVQEAQLRVQGMTNNVVTVKCADVCESDNIHPPTKTLLSRRVADKIKELQWK